MQEGTSRIAAILKQQETAVLEEWIKEQTANMSGRMDRVQEAEQRRQSKELLTLLRTATEASDSNTITTSEWEPVREFLADISRNRARQGFTPTETAMFVFSLKSPLFAQLRESAEDKATLAEDTWNISLLLDKLGLYTMQVFQKSREEIITRQQQEMLELSTPVVKLWDGVLALPLIGTLDSARTQVVMESLLSRIVETGSEIAIIDITGVLTVDTLVAQHLLKTVAATRLMGADCIISGIRPQIAQTIVHLGVDLSAVVTKATMAEAFKLALQMRGSAVVRTSGKS
ncbi:MAG: STAS domain-containing protein [Alphaproteobacteria bacterium]|nr:MAG: STAS domain-containing protein [Alphaproteobacteria bacterium]